MLDTFDLCFLSFYFFLPHTQCSLYLSIPMQTVQLHHTMFPIPTQRLSSQRISCAPQGFPSPHVWDLLEYHRDLLCELGSRTSSSSYVLLDPSWRTQLPRQVCGEQHTPLCSHQGEKRDKNGGINETVLGGRCLGEQVFGSHTEHLNRSESLNRLKCVHVVSVALLSLPAVVPLSFVVYCLSVLFLRCHLVWL